MMKILLGPKENSTPSILQETIPQHFSLNGGCTQWTEQQQYVVQNHHREKLHSRLRTPNTSLYYGSNTLELCHFGLPRLNTAIVAEAPRNPGS